MKDILKDAVEVGNATARAIAFNTRDKEAAIFKNGQWESGISGGSYEFLKNNGNGGRYLDARTRFFYVATVNTPAIAYSKWYKV
jgi:hypothetical protein